MRRPPYPTLLRLSLLLIGRMIPAPVAAETLTGHVVYVSDGDTLLLLTPAGKKQWIRLAEIDAPEKDQPGGLESKDALMQRVKGRIVEVDYEKRDGYGRLISHIQQDGANLNAAMVRNGHAWMYRRYSDSPALLRSEQEAKGATNRVMGRIRPDSAVGMEKIISKIISRG